MTDLTAARAGSDTGLPSMRGALLRRTFVGLLVIWIGIAGWVFADAEHELEELLDAHMTQAAALLIVLHGTPKANEETRRPDPPVLHDYGNRVAYQVFDEGQIVIHSANVGHEPMSQHVDGFVTIERQGQPWRVFATMGQEAGIKVLVAERLSIRHDILAAIMWALLIPLLVALALVGGLIWWSTQEGLRPLGRLRETLAKREASNLSPIDMADAPREMRPLLDALNEVLRRLSAKIESEKRLTSDAAHELRTPIAAIRAQAQVTQGLLTDDSPARRSVEAVMKGCDRAARVVEQLLALARLEHDDHQGPVATVLPNAIIAVCQELAPIALQRGQLLELDMADELLAPGQPTLWQVLVRNLVDNALRYSPVGAKVIVSGRAMDDGSIQVVVEDSGPGMAPEEIKRLGERFFRVLGSTPEGSGLGWSIVRSIADRLHAYIVVRRSESLGGLRVQVISAPPEPTKRWG